MPSHKQEESERKYIFFLSKSHPEARAAAMNYLREIGVRVLNRHGNTAIIGLAQERQIEGAANTGLFSGVFSQRIKPDHFERLTEDQRTIAELWNFSLSEEFRERQKDFSEIGKGWNADDRQPPAPYSRIAPEDFKEALFRHLDTTEEEFIKEHRKERQPERISGDSFVEFEERLRKIYENEVIAYDLARLAYRLDPIYYRFILELPAGFLDRFFVPIEPTCWKMEGEISVGLIVVESSREGGPTFSFNERLTVLAEVLAGLDWLATQAPGAANLSWVYDLHYVSIDVANGTNSDDEAYWRNPAMGELVFNGNTYSETWGAVADYREDLRVANWSQHAIVIFATPYATDWHAYAGGGRLTLANRNNWGGWGIQTLDSITAHEVCHLFGAADEYTGSGTPCSSCGGSFGCYNIPNGNCGACASPHQACLMDQNTLRLCAYTQGHIGWADLFVELTTHTDLWSGTDDNVWLDIGDRTFFLDTPNHDDRENGNVEGYALNYTGVTASQIKRIGIRKSPDGFAGGWKLRRVRVWHQGTLICDENNINQWLEDEYRWWASQHCGSSSDIVNRLRVRITTADVLWAGTDDDVRIYFGGHSWNLDNPSHDDFERGHTDTFDLDPGTSLYQSAIGALRVHKSPDGFAGGWRLKGVEIIVNGTTIYNNQSINKWLEDNDRDWYGSV